MAIYNPFLCPVCGKLAVRDSNRVATTQSRAGGGRGEKPLDYSQPTQEVVCENCGAVVVRTFQTPGSGYGPWVVPGKEEESIHYRIWLALRRIGATVVFTPEYYEARTALLALDPSFADKYTADTREENAARVERFKNSPAGRSIFRKRE